jgi:ketosteroid isomerase-like protein
MTIPNELTLAIKRHQAAFNAFLGGDPRLWKEHCSKHDDVTIIGAWGGFEKGWAAQVEARYEWAASRFRGIEGEATFETISLIVTSELAYSVDIERARVRLAGRDEVVPMVLRSTTIYRLEDGAWRMTHRHADPLIDIQGVASVRS